MKIEIECGDAEEYRIDLKGRWKKCLKKVYNSKVLTFHHVD